MDLYEQQLAVIRTVAGVGNNLNHAQITKMVNTIFDKNGWMTISTATVADIVKKNEDIIAPTKKGKQYYNNHLAMQVKRKAPPYPMVYWTLDGWTVELLYQERTAKGMNYSRRLVVVVVLDAYNKYPIGYAIGERETPDLIKEACRNAVGHVRELTGACYQPLQLQSDHYQIKNLTPFYQAVKALHYTPAAVGNSKAKIIEPYFMYLNKECQCHFANWSGFNVNSKKDNQVNRDMLDATKHQFPDKAGVIKQITWLMDRERAMKGADFMAKWTLLPQEDKVVMTEADYIMTFGEELGKTNRITGVGIEKQIDGVTYYYDSFELGFRGNRHLDWQLVGDKANLDKVLALSQDGKLRFLLERKKEIPMDLYSMTSADALNWQDIKDFNAGNIEHIKAMRAKDTELALEVIGRPNHYSEEEETDLKLMFTQRGQQKEYIQNAKGLAMGKAQEDKKVRELAPVEPETDMTERSREFLMGDFDFSQYND